MNKFLITILIFLFICNSSSARNIGETEITTEGGIEVFQEEKYYLLKQNVKIVSDELVLTAQTVKIFFDQDLYDIQELLATEKVDFNSNEYNIKGKGNEVRFNVKNQIIIINGNNSELFLENTKMISDGTINVNNKEGTFYLNGNNSKLISNDLNISGYNILGAFEMFNGKRNISNITVSDKIISSIKTEDIQMYSKKAVYDKKNSIIELFEEVKINRGNEIITGDYGIFNTEKKSYKVSSKNSKKVKVIISNSNE